MSDYEHIKALRYKPTEEEIDKIYAEMQEWRMNNPDKFSWMEADNRQDWGDYLEYVKYPDLINQESPFCPLFQIGFGDSERYLDLVLYSDYGGESGDWYKVRTTTPNEQAKYRAEFEKIFPGLDMSRVHLIDMCWYNCCEPNNCWELTDDDFNKEV